MIDKLEEIIASLEALRKDANLVQQGTYGWKSANKRFRKELQSVRRDMKDLRSASLDADR